MNLVAAFGGLVKSAKQAVVSAASTIKDTFAPSVEEGAARREKAFGTPNIGVTTAVVGGTAVAAIAAPAVIGSGALVKGAQAVGSKVVSSFTQSSLLTQGAVVAGGLVTAGAIARQPKKATKAILSTPGALTNFGGNLADFAANPTLDNAQSIWKENPVVTSAAVLGAAAVVGKGITGLVSSAANTLAIKENTAAMEKTIDSMVGQSLPNAYDSLITASSDLPLAINAPSSQVPITPETQVIGKSAGRSVSKRRPTKKSPQIGALRQSLRVNIFNQGKHLYTSRSYYS